MEERELGTRRNIARKRKQDTAEEASLEILGQWAKDADALTTQIDEKRRKPRERPGNSNRDNPRERTATP